MKNEIELCELIIYGNIIGVFSTIEKAVEYAEKNYPDKTFAVVPLGTRLKTDLVGWRRR